MAGLEAGTAHLAGLFARTVANDREVIKAAEEQLKLASQQPGYCIAVLKVVAAGDAAGLDARLAAAVAFKNFVKFRWAPGEAAQDAGAAPVPDDEKGQVRALLTGLMLSAPPLVRAQLSEALAIISGHDFPARWPGLLPELVARLGTDDLSTLNGVAATANSIFKRYRNQYGSNELVAELAATQDAFAPPALDALQRVSRMVPALVASGPPESLKLAVSTLRLLCRVFYSLNSPGLTPLMESQLDAWMAEFHTFLTLPEPPSLAEPDASKEAPLDALKAAVCANVNLFMETSEEEFAKFLQTFVTDVWHLLTSVSARPGQDGLAMAATRFLTTVARSVHSGLFAEDGVLRQVCEAIVLPSLRARGDDEELFEFNPIEYIRRDAEGSDADTRRRAAADLLRALSERFEPQVAALAGGYVSRLLQEYAAAPAANWAAKGAALQLVLAVAVRGRTGERGATRTSGAVDVGEFFASQVLPELNDSDVDARPMLKADALRFATVLRSQLPAATLVALLPRLAALLGAEAVVVHSYAATALERFLALREGGRPRLAASDVAPHAQRLLEALFAAFKHPESSENEYVMRAVARLIGSLGASVAPVAPVCLQALAGMLLEAAKNPKCPGFNHQLFEAAAALVRRGAAADPGNLARFEATLFPAFDAVLQQDVQEFHPYVFQILAQLIELSPRPLQPAYMAVFPPLLAPLYWERPGNVPPLTRLLQAYLAKAGDLVVSGGHLPPLLGVFQKLIASKANDGYGFALLASVVRDLPPAAYSQYLGTVWSLLFTRLQKSRTPRYVHGFCRFLALFIAAAGPAPVVASMDGVQPGVFGMVAAQVWLPAWPAMDSDPDDAKLTTVAAAKVVTECPAVYANQPLWRELRAALEARVQSGGGGSGGGGGAAALHASADADDDLGDEEGVGGGIGGGFGGHYAAAYARLANAAAPERPALPDIPDANQYAAAALAAFLQRTGGGGGGGGGGAGGAA